MPRFQRHGASGTSHHRISPLCRGHHLQPRSWAGKVETAVLLAQQFPEPVPSHSRSPPGSGAMLGSGEAPLPVTLLNTMWFASGLGSMPRAAHRAGLRWKALHKLATMTPNELLPCTWLWSTRFLSAATTAIPLPAGTLHTSPPGVHVLALLWSSRTAELFSISNPLTSPAARLWSTRTWWDWPT